VEANAVLLGEIVNVLLDNACRYSPAGSVITVSLSQSDEIARLEVTDRGQGIASADLPQVFTPSFRTMNALRANKQGVGLGLSIARRLAEALGGELNVASHVGQGCRFVITIPAEARQVRRNSSEEEVGRVGPR
jgi:signal transduction histidine kinase